MVMTSFNVINGIPSSANRMLFRDILREEWHFDGSTISDYAAIEETITNGLSKDGKDAAKRCIEAGVDIEMMSTNYITYGKQLIEEGLLSVELVDQAVRNILNLKTISAYLKLLLKMPMRRLRRNCISARLILNLQETPPMNVPFY